MCLKGGSHPNEGNIFVGGNPVCDDHWTLHNADIVCQQIGYFRAVKATNNSHFGLVPKTYSVRTLVLHKTGSHFLAIDSTKVKMFSSYPILYHGVSAQN